MTRVYWKSLRLVLDHAKRYISKWNADLAENLTSPQMEAVNEAYTAIVTCLAVLPPNTPEE